MTRKPRRHALSVPVRSGSEVGFPQSLGEVHDMLYDKSLERDNCGFGLIAHIEGEPSHKVVRTAIHALARISTVAQSLPMVKPATVAVCCCKNPIVSSASLPKSAAGV